MHNTDIPAVAPGKRSNAIRNILMILAGMAAGFAAAYLILPCGTAKEAADAEQLNGITKENKILIDSIAVLNDEISKLRETSNLINTDSNDTEKSDSGI